MLAKFEKKSVCDNRQTSVAIYRSVCNFPHWHMEFEIVCVFEGSAEVMVNNVVFVLKEGQSIFIKGEEVHYIKASPGSIAGVIKTDAETVRRISKGKRLIGVIEEDTVIKKLFKELLSEKDKTEYNEYISDALVTIAVGRIFREYAVPEIETTGGKIHGFKKLLEHIAVNYQTINFEEAAEYLNFNKSYFSRYFNKFAGMTFTKYLNTIRISSAVEKIKEGRLTITEISAECGFDTIRNFNRVFRELTGYSPRQLPGNFSFINVKGGESTGFDPTLACTEILTEYKL